MLALVIVAIIASVCLLVTFVDLGTMIMVGIPIIVVLWILNFILRLFTDDPADKEDAVRYAWADKKAWDEAPGASSRRHSRLRRQYEFEYDEMKEAERKAKTASNAHQV